MAMVILSIAAAGVILPFSGAASVQREASRKTLAAKLASDLLEQVSSTDFDDVILTYDGYTENAGQMENAYGEVLSDTIYSGFSRSVTCSDVYVANVGLILATVQVNCDETEMITLSTLIGP